MGAALSDSPAHGAAFPAALSLLPPSEQAARLADVQRIAAAVVAQGNAAATAAGGCHAALVAVAAQVVATLRPC